MANLGSLVVSLEANIAKFTSDMRNASENTDKAMKDIQGSINLAKKALEYLGFGLSAAGVVAFMKSVIDAADNLRDMSQKTGIAVENLNGLAFAAGQAGGTLDSIVEGANKLNKAITDTAGGNKDTAEAFNKLGISVKDSAGKLKSADVVMAEISDRFKNFADGPAKSAIALRIFTESGAALIPFLNDGGDAMRENIEYAKTYSNVTQELADGSDNFNDSMGKLSIQQKSFGNAVAAQVLPILQILTDELLGASEQSDKFKLASTAVRLVLETFVVTGSEVAFVFKAVGTEIGGIAAQIVALANRDFKGFTAISDAMKIDAEKARKEHDAFIDSILNPKPKAEGEAPATPDKPKPPAPTLRAAGDDPTKALLDGRLKAIEAAYASERDTASYHDKFMSELRAQDLVDVQTYEAYRLAALDTAAANAQRAYDAEIAVLKKARGGMAKEMDRADIDNKIKDVTTKKEQALLNAQQDRAVAILGQSAAQSDLNRGMKEWGIQQDKAIEEMEFTNSLYGKSQLEVAQLTEAHRAELEVMEQIRLAKEKGAISDESIARFQEQARLKVAGGKKGRVEQASNQIKRDQQTPGEAETDLHSDRLATIQASMDAEYETIAAGNQMLERENQRHEDAMMQQRLDGVNMAGDASAQLYSMMQQAGLDQTALGKALFVANKAIAVAEIIMNTEIAAAKALSLGPVVGIPLSAAIRVMGYASAGIVVGTTIASAEGGYDIPAGTNPVTQLHEKEMVLPKQHADVIRGLAGGGGAGAGNMKLTIVNQTSGHIGNVVEQRISATERALIIQEAVGATAAQLNDPNSKTSRSMSRNFATPRSR